jgi:hypothetical protein
MCHIHETTRKIYEVDLQPLAMFDNNSFATIGALVAMFDNNSFATIGALVVNLGFPKHNQ